MSSLFASLSSLKEIVRNRSINERRQSNRKDKWVHEIYYWENAIKTLAKYKKFSVYFWSTEEPRIFYDENESDKNENNLEQEKLNRELEEQRRMFFLEQHRQRMLQQKNEQQNENENELERLKQSDKSKSKENNSLLLYDQNSSTM